MSSKKKLFAIIAAVAMLAGMLAFGALPGVSATTTTVTAESTPAYSNTTINQNLGTILINGMALHSGTGDTITVEAPAGVTLNTFGTVSGLPDTSYIDAPPTLPATSVINGVDASKLYLASDSTSMVSFTVYGSGTGAVEVTLPFANLQGANAGALNATVFDSLGMVAPGEVVVGAVATSSGAGSTTTVNSTANVAQGQSGNVTITVTENYVGALEQGGYMKIKLPSYFSWTGVVGTPSSSGGWVGGAINSATPAAGQVGYQVGGNGDPREIDFYFPGYATGNTNVGVLQFTGTILAAYNAPTGSIVASVGGTDNGVTAASVTVGNCGNYGVTTTSGTGNILIGQGGDGLPTFSISESVPGTFISGRTLELQLPSGVYWTTSSLPDVSITQGAGTLDTNPSVSSDDSTLMYQIKGNSADSSTPTIIQFSQGEVDVAPNVTPGDLNITVTGAGITTTTVKDGTLAEPVTAAAADTTLPSIVVGQQNQKVSNFTITETASGNMGQKTLSLYAPPDTTFSNTPTVSVTAGNLAIGNPMLTDFNQEIDIPITTTSSTAGTVSVSGLEVSTNSSVPQGQLSVEIGGNALINYGTTENVNVNSSATANDVTTIPSTGYDILLPVANVTNGVTTTPGTGTSGSGSATFTIGATVYTVNGVQSVMDVAPYISNGRTFVPVRYLGDALGAKVEWDAATQTVTLTEGSNTVVLTIGSTTETVNGTAQTMDVAPVIVNGRTMLPARWVAEAFGGQVGWNPVTQQVLITYGSSTSGS